MIVCIENRLYINTMYLRCCRVRYLFRSKTAVRKIAHISSTDVCVTLRDNVKAAITQSFSAEMGRTAKLDIMPTQNAKFGDYQCSAAFSLASSLRKPPREVASAIVASIQCGDVIESASVAGGGFINMKYVKYDLSVISNRCQVNFILHCIVTTSPSKGS